MTVSRKVSGWVVRLGMGVIAGLAVGVIGLYVFVQSQTGLDFIASRMAQAISVQSASFGRIAAESDLAREY